MYETRTVRAKYVPVWILYFLYCMKVITHHLLLDVCKRLPRTSTCCSNLTEFSPSYVPTSCPRLSFAGYAQVNTNDVHGSDTTLCPGEYQWHSWIGYNGYKCHSCGPVYIISSVPALLFVFFTMHVSYTWFGGKRSCALKQQCANIVYLVLHEYKELLTPPYARCASKIAQGFTFLTT